jgi:hypothetical protein
VLRVSQVCACAGGGGGGGGIHLWEGAVTCGGGTNTCEGMRVRLRVLVCACLGVFVRACVFARDRTTGEGQGMTCTFNRGVFADDDGPRE